MENIGTTGDPEVPLKTSTTKESLVRQEGGHGGTYTCQDGVNNSLLHAGGHN